MKERFKQFVGNVINSFLRVLGNIVTVLIIITLLLGIGLGITVIKMNNNLITTNGEVNDFTLINIENKLAIANLIVTKDERVLINVESPGGSGQVMRKLITAIAESKVPVDTYVKDNAASAGALLFILGDHRYVNPNAVITFHGGHFGTYALTEATLKRAIDLLANGELERLMFLKNTGQLRASDVDIDTYKAVEVATAVAESCGLSGLLQTLDSMYTTLKISNELQVSTVYKVMVKSDPSITKEYVKSTIFKDFKLDATFTGQQLIDMGIAEEFKGEK